jgi:lysozyme
MSAPLLGIDVSHANGSIPWKAVARAGVNFAYVKATEGVSLNDPLFAVNWAGIRSVGLLRGAYHFFHPAKPVQVQAERFLRTVKQVGSNDLPPALDLEETSLAHDEWRVIEPARRAPLAAEWLERIERELGCKPLVYTRRGFVRDTLGNPGPLARYPVWIAHYTFAAQPALPAGWDTWTMWQFTDHGRLDGVSCNLDMNRLNGACARSLRLPCNDLDLAA